MTITVRLKTGNEAFADDKHGEITRILRKWLDLCARIGCGINGQRLYDYNGNHVGSITVTGK